MSFIPCMVYANRVLLTCMYHMNVAWVAVGCFRGPVRFAALADMWMRPMTCLFFIFCILSCLIISIPREFTIYVCLIISLPRGFTIFVVFTTSLYILALYILALFVVVY